MASSSASYNYVATCQKPTGVTHAFTAAVRACVGRWVSCWVLVPSFPYRTPLHTHINKIIYSSPAPRT